MDITNVKEFETFILKRICQKCRHGWFPRSNNPQKCPRCQAWLDKLSGSEGTSKISEMLVNKTG